MTMYMSLGQVDTPLLVLEPRHEKTRFCLCGNKGADQHLCFRCLDNTIPPQLIKKRLKLLAFFCGFIGQFMSETQDWFSRVAAHLQKQTDKV